MLLVAHCKFKFFNHVHHFSFFWCQQKHLIMCSSQNKLLQSLCIIRNRANIMDIKRQIINQFFYWLHTSVTSSTVVPLYIATLSAMKKLSYKRNDLSKRWTIWYCFTSGVLMIGKCRKSVGFTIYISAYGI